MVGIVIVSHSATLAQGVKELAEQMTQGQLHLAATGGIDDPDNPIGTDAMKVYEAIESVYNDDGVVILMDLGSALLSAEMAVEFLEPERQARVFLCEAPFVEGAMAAAVQASVGGDVQQVMAEARGALAMKTSQLAPASVATEPPPPTGAPAEAAPPETESDAERLQMVVGNRLGLHARPAARFVSVANQFASQITLSKGGSEANAKSINQVATLGVRQSDEILITARGPDAAQALQAIQALADDNFGDRDEEPAEVAGLSAPPPAVAPAPSGGELLGIAASPGIAIGPAFQYRPRLPEVQTYQAGNPDEEWQRLQVALNEAMADINQLHQSAVDQVGPDEAAIFEAHLLFLQDPALLDQAEAIIHDEKINAEAAWLRVIERTAADYRAMDDAYMQARAADLMDAGQRVLGHLMGLERPALEFSEPVIILAADLTPSDTAQLNPDLVLGLCTELGGPTSHSAILARALGIPAIVGLGPALGSVPDGQLLAMNGKEGRLWPQPEAEQLAELEEGRRQWLLERQRSKDAGRGPAITKDDHRVEIGANIGGPHDTAVALDYGAEGVGLFRTEFLFLDRQTAPSEEEQVAAYDKVAQAMGDRPVIIRTLDVGGDKPLPYIDLGQEENPFLGWRGIRFCLDTPSLFKTQLRAVLRASHGHNLKLMFPMIGSVAEVRAARALLAEARTELQAGDQPFDDQMEVGIMVEVPSAVAIADQLAREVDFFSIGTNDLTQYVMAVDRGNTRVAELASAFQPAVLRMVQQTVQAAHAAGIWVGMCGELAGNALAAPLLVGLGLDELSMSAPSIPAVKAAIRALSLDKARQTAQAALDCTTADQVTQLLQPI
ncbi:MAG: phosphoenolpyruvate--protein phosphotransferase [Chloroflexota bacterium]|jgi:phosphocarrier protein FPr